MESSTRNLMVLYGIVAFFSVVGVTLNIVQIFNLRSLDDPKITVEVVEGFSKGFYTIAFLYLIIALTSIGTMLKKVFSKSLLIVLAVLLIAIFVFGPEIFKLLIDESLVKVD